MVAAVTALATTVIVISPLALVNGAPTKLAERAGGGLSELNLGAGAGAPGQAGLDRRIVINPHITYPDTSALWETGQKGVNVTWDVPANAETYKGRLLLGYLIKGDSTGNEHLFPKPLAEDFNLSDGKVTFDIPCDNAIKSRSTYIVVLMGDSGNKSQKFTIHRVPKNCPNFKPASGKKNKSASSKTSAGTDGAAQQTARSAGSGSESGSGSGGDEYF